MALTVRRMACRKFCRVYGDRAGGRRRPSRRRQSRPGCFLMAPLYPSRGRVPGLPAPGDPKPSHTTPPGDAERLCHLQEILAQMYGNQDYPIEDDPSADAADDVDEDAPDDVAYPEEYAEELFLPGDAPGPLIGANDHIPPPCGASPPVYDDAAGMRLGPRDLPRKNWTPWTGRRLEPSAAAASPLDHGQAGDWHGLYDPRSAHPRIGGVCL